MMRLAALVDWFADFIGWELGQGNQLYMNSVDTLLYQLSAILTVFLVIFVLFWLCVLISRLTGGKR